jgi:hypothetical protein
LARQLRVDVHFIPCPVDEGDEVYANGIFEFNISKLIEYIRNNLRAVALEEVSVSGFYPEFSSINESHIASVDINQPVIVAEISPGRYNVIDGNH